MEMQTEKLRKAGSVTGEICLRNGSATTFLQHSAKSGMFEFFFFFFTDATNGGYFVMCSSQPFRK